MAPRWDHQRLLHLLPTQRSDEEALAKLPEIVIHAVHNTTRIGPTETPAGGAGSRPEIPGAALFQPKLGDSLA